MGESRVHQGTRAQRTLSEININILYLHAILCTLMLGLGWRDGITKGCTVLRWFNIFPTCHYNLHDSLHNLAVK